MQLVEPQFQELAPHVDQVKLVYETLDPTTDVYDKRRSRFEQLAATLQLDSSPVAQHMARVMTSFAPGLFCGGDQADLPLDNLELERSFRLPKGHERRIHGHAHAGVRIVQQGATLLLTLDAHNRHPSPFSAAELMAYFNAAEPAVLQESRHRRTIMRMARSTKNRPKLLAELEERYRKACLEG